ncbi:MAG: tRNA (guanosine(46)-N7)-methyltransferase TrmB [Lachnospiraceae bacterium]|nr:tRNA (guanosine(46)-N7)-methyltransferase TrmB [Lachnospiraceae bacterium]
MRLRNVPEAKEIVKMSPYVIGEPFRMRGKWREFADRPLYVEIGTGKGSFIMETARRHPELEFLGVERYESVLYRACEKMEGKEALDPASRAILAEQAIQEPKRADGKAPENLHFLSMDARDLPDVFAPGEVDGLYLNFSDPWPKARHAKRRLTSREFLAVYEKFLKDGGILEFKTDNRPLFDFSVDELTEAPNWEILERTYDLHHDPVMGAGNVMTEYEKKFSALGNKINKLKAVFHRPPN